jgi:LPS sulfotransferase NodH
MNTPVYLRSQVQPFVILFVGRVGSSYLTDLLNAHPNIRALYDEVTELRDKGAEAQLKWAEEALTPPLVGRYRAVGFKTKPANLVNIDAFTNLIVGRQCKVIQLVRNNRVKSVVSHLNGRRLAEATGMWGLFKESDRPSAFAIDPDEFDNVLHHREQVDQGLVTYVDSLSLPKLELDYEDLLQHRDVVLDKAFQFLGVNQQVVEGPSLKITSDNLRDVLLNFDELRVRYAGTPYEPMFDEVLV